MQRYTIKVFVPEIGDVQHITRARTKQAACDKIRRAYPDKQILFLRVASDNVESTKDG